jgi:hypothetical protein
VADPPSPGAPHEIHYPPKSAVTTVQHFPLQSSNSLYLSLTTAAAYFHSLILECFRDRGELAFLVVTVDNSLQRRTPNQVTFFAVKNPPTFSSTASFPPITKLVTSGLTYFDLNTLHSVTVLHRRHHLHPPVYTRYFTGRDDRATRRNRSPGSEKYPLLPKASEAFRSQPCRQWRRARRILY